MSRLQKTLTDYIVIAISPALIMILIGSLVFFAVEAFYQGDYAGRVRWIFACFVFAAVLIGRISIDEGREYAALFAIPLALAMLLVLPRFIQFQGPVAGFSLLINGSLIAIIWWCANKLTWDCTVIDEREDVSGQGLLQTAGLDRPEHQYERDPELDLDATSSRETQPVLGWWQRIVRRRRRPHAPGVWVIYISLAALPLFGIGQRFIPAANLQSRREAFWLLVYFVASALGLLLTSSFLGLRRYLRQRRLEMPAPIAGTWLVTGATMILALLVICTAFPRPHPEYSITHADWPVKSPSGLHASRYGVGRDGAEDPRREARTATARNLPTEGEAESAEGRPRDGDRPSQDASGGSPGEPGGEHRPDDSPPGRSGQTGESKVGPKGSAGNEEPNGEQASMQEASSSDQAADARKRTGESDPHEFESNARQARSPQPQGDRLGDRPADQPAGDTAGEGQPPKPNVGKGKATTASQSESNAADSKEAAAQPSPRVGSSRSVLPKPNELLNTALGNIPQAIKWLYYLISFAVAAFLVWKYRAEVIRALRGFLDAIRAFWAGLFGGSPVGERGTDDATSGTPHAPPEPFAAFANPFQTGDAQRMAPHELVVYSFRALEAWGREHDCPRMEDQTPHEFASRLGSSSPEVGREAVLLADLYCTAAYSNRSLTPASVLRLESLWKCLSPRATASPSS